MKKFRIFGLIVMIAACLFLTACGKDEEKQTDNNSNTSNSNNNVKVEGTLEEIMEKLYANIPEDDRPMALTNIPVDDDTIEGFLGTDDIEYDSILASEPMISSIAHSVVLVRVKDSAKVDATKKTIKENVNPRKWVCVGVEPDEVIIDNKGDLIVVIIVQDEDMRNEIYDQFKSL